MLQVHDSAARWRSYFEETCANKISTLAASWPKQISFAIDFAELQAWDVPFAELILNHPRVTIQNVDNVLAGMCRESGYPMNWNWLNLQNVMRMLVVVDVQPVVVEVLDSS